MNVSKIEFQIYTENDSDADILKKAICSFIEEFRKMGIAVTADKVANVLSKWDTNPFIKEQVIKYLRQ